MSRPVSLTIARSSPELAESSDDPRRRLLLRAWRLVNSDTKAAFRNPACQGSKSMKRRESTTLPKVDLRHRIPSTAHAAPPPRGSQLRSIFSGKQRINSQHRST
jgi:hypothetical protein